MKMLVVQVYLILLIKITVSNYYYFRIKKQLQDNQENLAALKESFNCFTMLAIMLFTIRPIRSTKG